MAKALDPDIYRNIEFDSWSDFRKEARSKAWYMGGSNFQVILLNYNFTQIYANKKNSIICVRLLITGGCQMLSKTGRKSRRFLQMSYTRDESKQWTLYRFC